MFGNSWTSNVEERLQSISSAQVKYWREDGNGWVFRLDSPSVPNIFSVVAPKDERASLVYDTSSTHYTLTFKDGTKKAFDSDGYLLSVIDRNANTKTISYNSSPHRITQVTGAGGQSVSFSYSNSQFPTLATSVQDSVGTIATYTYDSNGRLLEVDYPDGSALKYHYDSSNNILDVKDVTNKVIEQHTYDTQGRGTYSAKANVPASGTNNVESFTVAYNSDGTVTLTDSKNNSPTTYSFGAVGGRTRPTDIAGSTCASCGAPGSASFGYQSDGRRNSIQDANGHATSFGYDQMGNLRSIEQSDTSANYFYDYNDFGE